MPSATTSRKFSLMPAESFPPMANAAATSWFSSRPATSVTADTASRSVSSGVSTTLGSALTIVLVPCVFHRPV
jgi:hypothetical protein